ncbi:hypothetical protein BC936DRAFT_138701 [Jimgerdemannia flammicorona]|uniref:Uncharacterized protein n=2 Tax=Jimgerdemannia flammicorona TaxID=994334 RepID=A0A433QYU9_9FUNG|nr:hypothetical protein BC936DRAFT_138701 [Jimgerdemannia flammicorona]RUS34960.1 hypothetical protein BC938DRAFT_477410 [Jimgerdemannia flammicorona]
MEPRNATAPPVLNRHVSTTPSTPPTLIPHVRGHNLKADLRHCINHPELSDVTFICSDDATRKHAFRALLALRSDMFDRMLYGTMRESTAREIPLPTITSTQLQLVLEYCYLEETPSLTLLNAVSCYKAAEYFLLPRLQQLVVKFVQDNLADVHLAGEILSDAVRTLDVGLEMNELLFEAVRKFFLVQEWNIGTLKTVSREAMAVLLSDLPLEDINPPTTRAYIVFLCVVDWAFDWALDLSENPDEKLIGKEIKERVMRSLDVEKMVVYQYDVQVSVDDVTNEPQAQALISDAVSTRLLEHRDEILNPLMSLMHFEDICPHRLVTIMDTLGSAAPREIFSEAFRHHVLVRTVCPPSWEHGNACIWDHTHTGPALDLSHNNVKVSHPKVITKHSTSSVLAVCACKGEGVYTWDVLVVGCNPNAGGVSLGLATQSIVTGQNLVLGVQANSWGFASNGCVYDANPFSILTFDDGYGKGSVVSFFLDMKQRICKVTVDGVDHGVAWRNLPARIWPAASLSHGGQLEIRQTFA